MAFLDFINQKNLAFSKIIYVDQGKHSKKFDNAYNKFQVLEDIVAIIDNSMLKTGKSGVVFTDEAIYLREDFSSPVRYDISDIERLDCDLTLTNNTKIIINGKSAIKIVPSTDGKQAFRDIEHVVQGYIKYINTLKDTEKQAQQERVQQQAVSVLAENSARNDIGLLKKQIEILPMHVESEDLEFIELVDNTLGYMGNVVNLSNSILSRICHANINTIFMIDYDIKGFDSEWFEQFPGFSSILFPVNYKLVHSNLEIIKNYPVLNEKTTCRKQFVSFIERFLFDYEYIFRLSSDFFRNNILIERNEYIEKYIKGDFDFLLDDIEKSQGLAAEAINNWVGNLDPETDGVVIESVSKIFDEANLMVSKEIEMHLSYAKYLEKQMCIDSFRLWSIFTDLDNNVVNLANWFSFFDGIKKYAQYEETVDKLKDIVSKELEETSSSSFNESKYKEILEKLNDSESFFTNHISLFGEFTRGISEATYRSVSNKYSTESRWHDHLQECIFSPNKHKAEISEVRKLWHKFLDDVLCSGEPVRVISYELDEKSRVIATVDDIDNAELSLRNSKANKVEDKSVVGKAITELFNSQSDNIVSKLKSMGISLSVSALQNDDNIERVANVIHNLLPGVVRFVVKPDMITTFLLNNRQWLINKLI